MEFAVLGFPPVPWSVPYFGSGTSKSGKKYHFSTRGKKSRPAEFSMSLEDWQKLVRHEAAKARSLLPMTPLRVTRPPAEKPVILQATFFTATPPGKKRGQLWCGGVAISATSGKYVKNNPHEPDLTNLTKALEDAIQDSAIADDVLIVGHVTMKAYGTEPGVKVVLWGDMDEDYPGVGDPVPVPEKPGRKRSPRQTKCSIKPAKKNEKKLNPDTQKTAVASVASSRLSEPIPSSSSEKKQKPRRKKNE